MKRRDFIHAMPAAAILPSLINGYTVRALGPSPILNALTNFTTDTDHVLVIIQLTGGNDGLNMVIPKDQYAAYFSARSNIAIPENKILALTANDKTGLHPSMTGIQQLYNNGKAVLVQSAGYPQPNFSHFRATDIWMSGSSSDQVINTGWAGRYLNLEYPNFPDGYPNPTMPDPLAIQIGSISSLTFQGPAINMAMSITNPTSFYNLINGIQDPAPATHAGKELTYIRTIARQTELYATSIKNAANLSPQQLAYPPNNQLGDQLKIVARLIKGGLKTRIYMVGYGGFDTHSVQTATDTTIGNHANLLATLSDAMKAFQDDLSFLGIEDRVISFTFSEFGRRIKSNSSLGTDHGAAAPLFVFGSKVQSGVLGQNPTIPTGASVNDNIPHQYDYRSVYASVLQDWFCSSSTDLQTVLLQNFQTLPIIKEGSCPANIDDLNNQAGNNLIFNYPNPFADKTTITFKTKGGHTLVQVMDCLGRVISTPVDQDYPSGTYTINFDGKGLPNGVYYLRLQNGPVQQVKPSLKVR